jgi:hypothetical protein
MTDKAYVVKRRPNAYCVRHNPKLHPAYEFAVRLTRDGEIYQRGPTARKAWEWAAVKLKRAG